MIVHDLGWLPIESCYLRADALEDEYDLDKVRQWGAEEVWYYYGCGDYEGNGKMIARRKGRWFLGDLGHCSCYGPVDDLVRSSDASGYDSVGALMVACSEELRSESEVLVRWIETGNKPLPD